MAIMQDCLLSQDFAIKKTDALPFAGIIEDLAAAAVSVIPAEDFIDPAILAAATVQVRENFNTDYARMAAHADLVFGDDFESYGPAAAALFSAWENEGGGPSLPAMIAQAAVHFGLDIESALLRAAFMAAILGEYPNTLQYHGNEHYRKVLCHTLRLISANNRLFVGTNKVLAPGRISLLLAAACMHDLGHAGGDNLRDGVYTPGFMEQRALDIVRPYFDAAGLSDDDRGEIETIVFCTDITFFAGDNSPCVRMKKLFKYYFWDEDVGDASMLMMGRLRRYEDNPQLVRMAMLLHEADVGTSAGLSYEQTIKETINIMEERDLKIAGPGVVITFLREQLGETMYTEAGKQVFGPAMREIIKRAESEHAEGRRTFYE